MDKNYEYTLEIDTNPSGVASWKELMDGIKNLAQAINEVIFQTSYLSDQGWGQSAVTGAQFIITLAGNRIQGDEAQDYIFATAMKFAIGTARETNLRVTAPDGVQITVPCTLAKLTESGGDSNQPTDITIEIHGNGAPTIVESGQAIGQITVVSIAGAADAGDTEVYVNPALTDGSTYVYKTGASVDIPAYGDVLVAGWTAWNGTADIAATTGHDLVIAEIAATLALKAGKATATSA